MRSLAFISLCVAMIACRSDFKIFQKPLVLPAEPNKDEGIEEPESNENPPPCDLAVDPQCHNPPEVNPASPMALTGGELFVMAHQDDDLLFVNPDIIHAIKSGEQVRTVYLSSGEAGLGDAYWQSREKGIEAAYAAMAGVSNDWETTPYTFAEKSLHLRTLKTAPQVSVMFLRLPDGMVYGNGTATYAMATIEKLWKGSITSIPSSDFVNTFTRENVIDVLLQIMTDMKVDRVSSLDSSKEIFSAGDVRSWFTHDNSDHIFSAYFAFEAQRRYAQPHDYRFYIGYTVEDHAQNVPTSDFNEKFSVVKAYTPFDSQTCGNSCAEGDLFGFWSKRKVNSIAVKGSLKGRINIYGNLCLEPIGASSTDGTALQIAACNQNPEQQWQLNAEGRLTGLGDKCAGIRGVTAANETVVELSTCNDSLAQKWTMLSNGQIRGMDGKCLDVKNGATTAGSPVQISGCNWLAQQTWSFMFPEPGAIRSNGSEFSNADISSNVVQAKTFRLARLDASGRSHACIMKSTGVYCAKMQENGSFASYTQFMTDITAASAWGNPEYGGTIMYADISGDGKDDLCARGIFGIACAEINSTATAFVNFGLRSVGGNFSDAEGWNASGVYYDSIRLGDVNGDKKADVCGRFSDGMRCALNNGAGMFGETTLWLSSAEAAAGEWANLAFASSTQLADIDNDGKADVCFMTTNGISCAFAKATGDGFERYHRANYTGDMVSGWQGSSSYYRSIRFADINADGFLDICGRSSSGMICGFGLGTGYFDKTQKIMPQEFTDGAGWNNALYGPNLHFADLNNDGKPDLCGRGFFGILCSIQL